MLFSLRNVAIMDRPVLKELPGSLSYYADNSKIKDVYLGTYYYMCGTEYLTGNIHCTKSMKDFQDFDTPKNYTSIRRISIPKQTADRKIPGSATPTGGLFGALSLFCQMAGTQTGEDKILKHELGTNTYSVFNK